MSPARSAVLRILGPSAFLKDAKARITYDAEGRVFTLGVPSGDEIAECEHPVPLNKHAWANGVVSVTHAYDLGIVEAMDAKAAEEAAAFRATRKPFDGRLLDPPIHPANSGEGPW